MIYKEIKRTAFFLVFGSGWNLQLTVDLSLDFAHKQQYKFRFGFGSYRT
jgi:hypothetical protein